MSSASTFNMNCCCFLLFKQKTAYEMRISDWSSDVCSSDLELVLIGTVDLEIVSHVLGGFGHRVDAVLGLHEFVDEAPADGGVVNGGIARERRVGLAHDERRAAHAFDAAGQHQAGFAGRSEEHTSELQSLMRISYAVFCLKKKNT